jgi:hypothetical protein
VLDACVDCLVVVPQVDILGYDVVKVSNNNKVSSNKTYNINKVKVVDSNIKGDNLRKVFSKTHSSSSSNNSHQHMAMTITVVLAASTKEKMYTILSELFH